MRCRYILSGVVNPTDKLSDFRLIGGNNISHSLTAIRVMIPDDVKLTKYSCDNYSTTDCNIQIKDLQPIIICKVNGRFIESPELKNDWLNGLQPHQFLEDKKICGDFGVVTDAQYEWFYDNKYIAYRYNRIPVRPDGSIINKPIPSLKPFMKDVNQFKNVISEKKIPIFYNDEIMAFWYNICCRNYRETKWLRFETIKNIDAFIDPYVSHVEIKQDIKESKFDD